MRAGKLDGFVPVPLPAASLLSCGAFRAWFWRELFALWLWYQRRLLLQLRLLTGGLAVQEVLDARHRSAERSQAFRSFFGCDLLLH